MKVSEAWLREWTNPSLAGQALADQLTMAGLEVDGIYPVAGVFSKVIVAQVVQTAPHPQADKLTICQVDTGDGSPITVVCGASNVRTGLRVALACVGAELPGGLLIQETSLRGESSHGMLCSSTELGLDDRAEGIIELPIDAPIGMDLREYMQLNDQIFEIELTPNRADCLSVFGVAREVAALNHLPIPKYPIALIRPTITDAIDVTYRASDACPYYAVRVIRGINPNAVTPLWMKERLRRSGIRALHPVVDVMNYVMIALGQPLHAFNLASIRGGLTVRYSEPGESITLLDGQSVRLTERVLVIADEHTPLAIAGVMGGQDSAVQAGTTDLVIESAFFTPRLIAGVARSYGLCTDASQRFERGVDPALPLVAMDYATDLLLGIVGGGAGPVVSMTDATHLPVAANIQFQPDSVSRLTGMTLPHDTIAQILQRLNMVLDRTFETHWVVHAPSYRFDMAYDVDLIEEVIRLYGYHTIRPQPLMVPLHRGEINPFEQCTIDFSKYLSNRGYHETISYSFVDPAVQEDIYPNIDAMHVLNPISSELSVMRVGLWSGLLASMVYNAYRQQAVLKLFEAGVVFIKDGDDVIERPSFAGLLFGEQGGLNWADTTRCVDFYDMKGDLESLFTAFKLGPVSYQPALHPALHPGQSAQIIMGGRPIGWLGVVHPRLIDALDLTGEVVVFELDLSACCESQLVRYQPISKYPQTRRDLSLLAEDRIDVSLIKQAISEVIQGGDLKSVDVFDVYIGPSIPEGYKSVALALTFQAQDRTLVDNDINQQISAILYKLAEDFSISMRMDVL